MGLFHRICRGLQSSEPASQSAAVIPEQSIKTLQQPKAMLLTATVICREAVLALSDSLGPNKRVAIPGPPGIWEPTVISTRVTINRSDLGMSLEKFSERYIAPVMTTMAGAVPADRMLWPIPQPCPPDTFSASEMWGGVAILLEEVQPEPGEISRESDMRLRFSIQTVPKE